MGQDHGPHYSPLHRDRPIRMDRRRRLVGCWRAADQSAARGACRPRRAAYRARTSTAWSIVGRETDKGQSRPLPRVNRRPRKGRSLMSILAKSLTACALGALLAGASVNAYALDAEHKADWSKIHILLVPWSQSSNSFFEAVVNGAKDAAEQQGVQVDIQFGEEDQNREKTILETAV